MVLVYSNMSHTILVHTLKHPTDYTCVLMRKWYYVYWGLGIRWRLDNSNYPVHRLLVSIELCSWWKFLHPFYPECSICTSLQCCLGPASAQACRLYQQLWCCVSWTFELRRLVCRIGLRVIDWSMLALVACLVILFSFWFAFFFGWYLYNTEANIVATVRRAVTPSRRATIKSTEVPIAPAYDAV